MDIGINVDLSAKAKIKAKIHVFCADAQALVGVSEWVGRQFRTRASVEKSWKGLSNPEPRPEFYVRELRKAGLEVISTRPPKQMTPSSVPKWRPKCDETGH